MEKEMLEIIRRVSTKEKEEGLLLAKFNLTTGAA
jgi:hypothetical protein